jgi:hypothetical protein
MSDDLEEQYIVEVTEPCAAGSGVSIDDFYAYMPNHSYIFTPCREFWAAASINARVARIPVLNANGRPKRSKGKIVTVTATTWLDQNRPIEQMTWCPGEPMLIPDRLVVDGGWIERKDVTCFNLYRPPRIEPGDAAKAGPWIEHAYKVYPDDAGYIIQWLAQRVQHPADKINHALVLGGAQGIGKDSMLEPVKYAIGPWNFHEVSPTQMLGRFNSFIKSVILRVSEARDLGEIDRFKFYDHSKVFTAAPPDVLRVDEKNLREHYVFNCLGFVITTNHKTDGIYLPADDRRHYVAWSNRHKEDYPDGYWKRLWDWYQNCGFGHVAAYLGELDLSGFDAKAPPPKTPAFWNIVNASQAPEDAELADVLDALGSSNVITRTQLITKASGGIAEWLMERKNWRTLPHRLERCGYVMRNPDRDDGLWILEGVRQVIYAKTILSLAEQLRAARELEKEQPDGGGRQ